MFKKFEIDLLNLSLFFVFLNLSVMVIRTIITINYKLFTSKYDKTIFN